MKNVKRNSNDATAPIIKPCFVDVASVWKNAKKKTAVSRDLSDRVLKALLKMPEKA